MPCETLQHLRNLPRPGDYFVSLDLADGYFTLGIREEDRDFFTVNHRGELYRLGLKKLATRLVCLGKSDHRVV
jgi:hypothetical protein